MLSGADQTIGDKDAPPPPSQQQPTPETTSTPAAAAAPPPPSSGGSGLPLAQRSRPSPSSLFGPAKSAKRLKKSGNHPMYDNYRMVRPPASTWDRKARYEAIGRDRRSSADYDDVFVVSALLHHVSVVRVRVPDRLMAVLAGEVEEEAGERGWGRLEVWRSRWFDFFKVEDRVEAMKLVWSVMAYMMREVPVVDGGQEEGEDVAMAGA